MILMQESGQSVSFSPQFVCYGNPPWYEKLFALYLAFMVLLLLVRAIHLAWNLVGLRRFQREGSAAAARFRALWLAAHARADALNRFSFLTFVLVLADLCLAAADLFVRAGTVKVSGTLWFAIDAAHLFGVSAAGLLVCAALYAASFFFQARLVHRELSFAREKEEHNAASSASASA